MITLRWLLAWLIFASLLLLATWALLRYHPLPSSRPAEPGGTWQACLDTPAPPYIPADFLEHLARQASLPDSPPVPPEKLLPALHTLAQLLRLSPWVKNVTLVQQPAPTLQVEWVRVVPVAFLTEDSPVPSTFWLVSENFVWLSKLSQPDLAASLPALPIYIHPARLPEPEPRTALPRSLARALLLSLTLSPHRDSLGLARIILGRDPVTLDIQVLTRGGSYILWETLDGSHSDSVSDDVRINRLADYVRTWHSLDNPAGPYFFDNRRPGPLLRRPLK